MGGTRHRRQDINFDLAMRTTCASCGKPASNHRMTATGNLYCTVLNEKGVWKAQWVGEDLKSRTGHIPVRYLERGGFSDEVKKAIKAGLSTYLPERNT